MGENEIQHPTIGRQVHVYEGELGPYAATVIEASWMGPLYPTVAVLRATRVVGVMDFSNDPHLGEPIQMVPNELWSAVPHESLSAPNVGRRWVWPARV